VLAQPPHCSVPTFLSHTEGRELSSCSCVLRCRTPCPWLGPLCAPQTARGVLNRKHVGSVAAQLRSPAVPRAGRHRLRRAVSSSDRAQLRRPARNPLAWVLFTESQNHRMVGVGRALCGSPSPAPCPSRVTQSRLHSTASRCCSSRQETVRSRASTPISSGAL